MPTDSPLRIAGVFLVACWLALPVGAADPAVRNVRARQLANRTVEVLYDLTGAPAAGATVSVVFSRDGGATYTIVPVAAALSGHVGPGVTNGTDRRIVWNVPVTLPADFFSAYMLAAVTAVEEITIHLGPNSTVPMVLVSVPGGTFPMGTAVTERMFWENEFPLHPVTLTQGYYLGKTEVTQGQWQAVMGTNPSIPCGLYGVGDSLPVYCISWNEICGGATGSSCAPGSFIGKLNTLLGSTKYRMPTEAEWERAVRGGTTGDFSFAVPPDWVPQCVGGLPEADPYMWWCGNDKDPYPFGVKPVGTKQANPFGLHDMHGNVAEWVGDWYGPYPASAVTDPPGPSTGTFRVVRNGEWSSPAKNSRSAVRQGGDPQSGCPTCGFRLARSQ